MIAVYTIRGNELKLTSKTNEDLNIIGI